MSAALATIERNGTGRAMIVADALTQEGEQRKLLGEYVARHMQEDTDYGIIPGTKNRTLLKPGAEKLTTLFRCVPRFVVEEKIENWETGLFFYRFACHIETLDGGNVVAEGVGSCSSYESRYRWRNGDRVCPHCGVASILKSKKGDGFFCWAKKGGCGANFAANDESITSQATGRVQNPDLADCANTVLKMAKKRAHVDAAIALARCSDIFTQDVEDFQESHRTPDEPARSGNYDPRTVPGVKSGADLRNIPAEIAACKTLAALGTLWTGLSKAEQTAHLAAKDKRKAELQAEGEQGPHPTSAAASAARTSTTAANAIPSSSGTPSTAPQTDTLPKAPRTGPTAESISDLILAVAEATQQRDLHLLTAVCDTAGAGALDDMTADQLRAADAWLREQATVAA